MDLGLLSFFAAAVDAGTVAVDSMPAVAEGGPTAVPRNPTGELIKMGGFFVAMAFMFYFMIIRPQSKKAKDHANLLKSLKSGDKVTTSGGVIATVMTVKEKTVTLRSGDSKFEVLKSAVADITERGTEAA